MLLDNFSLDHFKIDKMPKQESFFKISDGWVDGWINGQMDGYVEIQGGLGFALLGQIIGAHRLFGHKSPLQFQHFSQQQTIFIFLAPLRGALFIVI